MKDVMITVKSGIVSPKEVKEELKKGLKTGKYTNRFYWNQRDWWCLPTEGKEMDVINFALGLGLQVEVWTDKSMKTLHPVMVELNQPGTETRKTENLSWNYTGFKGLAHEEALEADDRP